jgi:uncharacterized protein YuzE
MIFEYDKDADALEITLRNAIVARTVEIDAGTLVDVDEAGVAVSIEVIRPARVLPIDQIVGRFQLADDDIAVLRSMWTENGPYPFEAHEFALVAN